MTVIVTVTVGLGAGAADWLRWVAAGRRCPLKHRQSAPARPAGEGPNHRGQATEEPVGQSAEGAHIGHHFSSLQTTIGSVFASGNELSRCRPAHPRDRLVHIDAAVSARGPADAVRRSLRRESFCNR